MLKHFVVSGCQISNCGVRSFCLDAKRTKKSRKNNPIRPPFVSCPLGGLAAVAATSKPGTRLFDAATNSPQPTPGVFSGRRASPSISYN